MQWLACEHVSGLKERTPRPSAGLRTGCARNNLTNQHTPPLRSNRARRKPAYAAGRRVVKSRSPVRALTIAFTTLGLGVFAFILYHSDLSEVWRHVTRLGWVGLGVVVGASCLWFVVDTVNWTLTLRSTRLDARWFCRLWPIHVAGEALNHVTPFASVGGEPMKAMLINQRYAITYREGTTSLILLHVVNVCAEIPFLLLGIALALVTGVLPVSVEIMMVAGGVLIVALVVVLWLVQHYRFVSRVGRRLSRAWFGVAALRVVRHIRAIEGRLMEFYLGRPRQFFAACALQFCNWSLGAVEIYLVLHFLGAPIPFVYALVIESVVVLVRTALFFIPSNIGAQEGTFLVVCGAITGSPELGVAVALIRRFRELFWISAGLLIGWVLSLKTRGDTGRDLQRA